ncbi:MAG: hypothetical protein QXZ40_02200, partial [Candidatus Micrarchaeia archaeon]
RERSKLITLSPFFKQEWVKLKCDTEINRSVAQVLHIVDGLCVEEMKGEQYEKMRKPFLCTSEDAKKIDEAVRRKNDCTFPLGNPLDEKTKNYFAFVLVCVADLTNWSYVGGACPVGYPQSLVYVVVDEGGSVYY